MCSGIRNNNNTFNVKSFLWMWLPIALLGSLPFIAYRVFSPATFTLEIEAEVSKGQSFQIFLNNDWSLSPSMPVVPGKVHNYQFTGVPPSTTSLRIDPGEQPDSRIRLYSARTFRNQELVKEVIFSQGSGFQCWSCDKVELFPDSTHFVATSNDPIFIGDYSYTAKFSDRLWAMFGNQLSTLYLKIALACVFLLLLIPFSPRKFSNWLMALPLILLPVLVLLLSHGAKFLGTRIVSMPDFSQAVGFSTFSGRPKQDEYVIFHFLVMASILIAVLLFMAARKIFKRIELPAIELPIVPLKKNQFIFLGVVLLGIAVLNFPEVENTLRRLVGWHHPADWDAQSLGTWRYAVSKDLLPYRDFWFPYGGAWNTNGLFVGDQIRFFFHCLFTYGVFFLLLFILSQGQIIPALLFGGLIWWGAQDGYLLALSRYLLPANLLLFYLVLLKRRVSHWLPYAVFGVYFSWVFSFESTLAVYASLPIVIVFVIHALQNHKDPNWRQWILRTHSIWIAACLIGISTFLVSLYIHGQLPGYIEFHRDLKSLSLIAAFPGEISEWLRLTERPDSLVLISTLLLFFWGGWLILWYWKKPEQWLGIYLFAFGCLSFAIYNKYLMRPDMVNQLLVVPIIGLFLYFVSFIGAFSGPQKVLVRVCGVCVVAALYFSPVGNVLAIVKARAQTLPRDVQTLVVNPGVISAAEASFYAPARFAEMAPGALEILNYVKNLRRSVDIKSMYVLGQDQYLYMLLGELPPYYLTIWEGGTQRAQMRTLSNFAKNPPDIIFYNPSVRSFDGVPDQVRAPRIYQYVVANYKVIGNIDKYVVLGRRPDNEDIDYQRWGELLGRDVSLGFIPGSTSLETLPECTEKSGACGDYLVVTLAQDPGVSTVTTSLSSDFGDYQITWSTRANQRRYAVPLLRLWFWPQLSAVQNSIDWKIPGAAATFEVVHKGDTDQVLY